MSLLDVVPSPADNHNSRSSSSTTLTAQNKDTEAAQAIVGGGSLHDSSEPTRRDLEGRDGNAKEKDHNLVDWDIDDPLNPKNWSTPYKIFLTFQLGMLALAASMGSSILSPAQQVLARETGVTEEVSVLALSFYVLGFAFGPLVWAPVSEVWGRRVSLLPAMFVLGIFSIGTAVSHSAAAIFVTRFFGGVFASAPVSNVSAALGDIYSQAKRGYAVSFYSVMVVGGPTFGPVIGSALVVNPGWRWTEYLEAVFAFATVAFGAFFLPEVYGPVILKKKAQRLRKETGNQSLYHPHENLKLDFKSIVTKQFSRPLLMLFTEPPVTAIAVYASFVYSLLYMALEVFPLVFEEMRGWSPVVGSLPFLAMFVGILLGTCVNLSNQPRYMKAMKKSGGRPVPEERLPPLALGSVIFAIGLFWFGWTAKPGVPWPAPVCAAIFIGAGFNAIFQQCINFLVDTYTLYAASAVSANTFLRSILASTLPLAVRPMIHNIGVGPGMSILGAFATVAIPMPFLLMKYGKSLRKRSRYVVYQGDDDDDDRADHEKVKQEIHST